MLLMEFSSLMTQSALYLKPKKTGTDQHVTVVILKQGNAPWAANLKSALPANQPLTNLPLYQPWEKSFLGK